MTTNSFAGAPNLDTPGKPPRVRGMLRVLIVLATLGSLSLVQGQDWKGLISPDGQFRVKVAQDQQGRPLFRVKWQAKDVILPSTLGFELEKENDADWTQGFGAAGWSVVREERNSWNPVWGERSRVVDHYRTAIVRFPRGEGGLSLELRAYNQGIAFRYLLDVPGSENVTIKREHTHFKFTADHPLWAVTSAQGMYSKKKISELGSSVERPCVLEPVDGLVIAIAEAALVDYARMRLGKGKEPNTLVSNLHGSVKLSNPLMTPWRVVMAANDAGGLLENNDLLLNLNEPCKIVDTSWIRPGKVIRDTSLSTDGGMNCVDFAVATGLKFIEFDAGWYGSERELKSDARTVSRANLDLPRVIDYAKQHDIGVILYVNRRHLERDLDDLLPIYKEWGIAGLKYGFVQHGSQKWTAWMHEAVAKAAKYEIMVDVHDEYRMTGWQRTYPHFMTAEGIGGDETRPSNDQALANLFTRMIASPADHTFCYYNGYVRDTTSHAAQLAKMVCFFSPWQFVFWYDRPHHTNGEPELNFIKHLPTTWDETRVLHGRIGEYAAIARRAGSEWFIGCFNAGEPRTLDMNLDFLPAFNRYEAIIYRDDPGVRTATKVGIERQDVDKTSVIKARMSGKGGVAIRIVPKE